MVSLRSSEHMVTELRIEKKAGKGSSKIRTICQQIPAPFQKERNSPRQSNKKQQKTEVLRCMG